MIITCAHVESQRRVFFLVAIEIKPQVFHRYILPMFGKPLFNVKTMVAKIYVVNSKLKK